MPSDSTRAVRDPRGPLAEPLPTRPDPALIRYVDYGEPGRWIVLIPILLAVAAIVAVLR